FGKEKIPMSETSTLIPCNGKITRMELGNVPTPPATATHVPIPHLVVVEGLIDTLSRRHTGVVGEEYAVSKDGMEMFGVIDLERSLDGCRFAIGIRKALPTGLHRRASRVRLSQSRVSRGLQPRPRETLGALLSRRQSIDWRRPDAAQLRADAETSR